MGLVDVAVLAAEAGHVSMKGQLLVPTFRGATRSSTPSLSGGMY